MSFADKLKARLQEVSNGIVSKITGLLVEESESQRRMEICNECPSLINITKTCRECGCFMTAKTKLQNVECPIKKW